MAPLGTDSALGRSPRGSLDAGVAMIPESRKDKGLIFGRSVVENTTLPSSRDYSSFGVVRRRVERRAARRSSTTATCARRAMPRPW